jgi:hypothetical protein
VSSFYYAIIYILSVNIAHLKKKCNSFFGGEWQYFCLGELVGLAGQRVLPLTYLCDFSRLVAAASYIEGDVSPGLWQLVTAASYIEGDVSPGLWRLDAGASYIEADVSAWRLLCAGLFFWGRYSKTSITDSGCGTEQNNQLHCADAGEAKYYPLAGWSCADETLTYTPRLYWSVAQEPAG